MSKRESQRDRALRLLRQGIVLRKVRKGPLPLGTLAMLDMGMMNGGDVIWKARKKEPRIRTRMVTVGTSEDATEVAEYYLSDYCLAQQEPREVAK